MVVVEFLYEEMRKLTGLTREEVVEGLTQIGAPSEYESETRKVMTELTPNRPDWYSTEGLARALKSYYRNEFPKYQVKKSAYTVLVDGSVGKVRPCTVCAVVKGLKFSDERIIDMVLLQEKLLATLGRRVKRFGIGIYPLDAIKFPVKYTTMKPEQIRYRPLGYPREAGAMEILDKHPKGQEYGHLIRGLPAYPVFVDADGKIMAMLPVVNSEDTGKVDVKTKDVFVEVTGMDMNSVASALNIIVCSFADMGGTVHSVEMQYPDRSFISPDLADRKMRMDLPALNRLLGTKFGKAEVAALLARMGYRVDGGDVLVPPYRADIISFVDVIEDVAIAYGYNNLEPTLPDFFSAGKARREFDRVGEVMKGMGFMETDTFILTNEKKLEKIGYGRKLRRILNPSGEDFTAMRPTLLSDMLDTFVTNKTKGLPQRFFELGWVYTGKTERRLAFGIMDRTIEFSEARGYLQTFMRELGSGFSLKTIQTPLFDKETGVGIIAGGKEIGVFGGVDRKVLESLGVDFRIYLCEMELGWLR